MSLSQRAVLNAILRELRLMNRAQKVTSGIKVKVDGDILTSMDADIPEVQGKTWSDKKMLSVDPAVQLVYIL